MTSSGLTFYLGYVYRKKITEKRLADSAREVMLDVENKRKEMLLEAKEEAYKERESFEKDMKFRLSVVQKQENKIQQKLERLDKKQELLDEKEAHLDEAHVAASEKLKEAEQKKLEIIQKLEKVADFTVDEAKEFILEATRESTRQEQAIVYKEICDGFKEESENKAKNILCIAIQRCAVDHSAELTVTVVNLPNEDAKGRIIGREGRNIRSFEMLTGVDCIVDDTPEAVILSSFDPVRREIARMTLERLILDGRIHPARIEEMLERCTREMNLIIKKEGDAAALDAGVNGLPSEILKLLGRLKYRTSYGQNVLKHSIEVARIAGLMAAELRQNEVMARRAGLLHDIGKAVDHETEGSHVTIGADLAKKYKENDEIVNAIMSHHGDVETKSLIAVLVQSADAISASRPGARRENVEKYIKRLKKLEAIANSFQGVDKSFAIQAGREVRIIVKPEEVDDATTAVIAREIVKKVQNELEYPGQIKVNVIRELRAVDYAT